MRRWVAPQCDQEPASIVVGWAIGLETAVPRAMREAATTTTAARLDRPTTAKLEARVHKLEVEVLRLRDGRSTRYMPREAPAAASNPKASVTFLIHQSM